MLRFILYLRDHIWSQDLKVGAQRNVGCCIVISSAVVKAIAEKEKCHLHSGSSHFYKDVCVSVCVCTLLNYQKGMYTNADTEALTVTATYRVEARWDQGERKMLSQRLKYVGENTLHTFFTKLCEGVVSEVFEHQSLECLPLRNSTADKEGTEQQEIKCK